MKISTSFYQFRSGYGRWVAIDEDTFYQSSDLKGVGLTEQQAINDLRQQLAEKRGEPGDEA
jgi:hypothetical protein